MTTSLNTLSLQTRSASIALALAMAAGSCLAQDSAAASFEPPRVVHDQARPRERPARGVLRAAVRAPAECDRARAAERQRHRPARRRAD